MNYFFYNTDAGGIKGEPKPRYPVLIENSFAAAGGQRKFGEKFNLLDEGDILFMYENRLGVVAIGKVKEKWDGVSHETPRYYTPYELKTFSTGAGPEYRIAVDWVVDCSQSPITLSEICRRLGYKSGYSPRGVICPIKHKDQAAEFVDELLSDDPHLPEEVTEPGLCVEGARRRIWVNAYERDPQARRRCIEHFGASCCICGFTFGKAYGKEAEGYIHVHHLVPLSELGSEYVVNPIEDLRPVCPNCHAVLHLGDRCRTIKDVKRLITRKRR